MLLGARARGQRSRPSVRNPRYGMPQNICNLLQRWRECCSTTKSSRACFETFSTSVSGRHKSPSPHHQNVYFMQRMRIRMEFLLAYGFKMEARTIHHRHSTRWRWGSVLPEERQKSPFSARSPSRPFINCPLASLGSVFTIGSGKEERDKRV